MLGCPDCEYDICRKHFPTTLQCDRVTVTIINAVTGADAVSVIMGVELPVSMLKNLAEELTMTPSRFQQLTLAGATDVLDDEAKLKSLLPAIYEVGRLKLRVHLIRMVPDQFALLRACASPFCDALTVRYILGACPECRTRMNLRYGSLAAINNGQYEEYTALVIAASQGHRDACEELCHNTRYKEALNSAGQNGSTDLHVGASFNFITPHVPLCQMLLDAVNFTNAAATDHGGNTAVHIAKLRGHHLLARMIESHHSFKVGFCNVDMKPTDII